MPYIDEALRKQLTGKHIRPPANVGELNFLITALVDEYISANGLRYEVLNGAIGVLECAKLELYRRIVAPYETKKIEENGDVYMSGRDFFSE